MSYLEGIELNHTSLKSIAFPREHGAYGFTIEPLMLALLVAFSWPGFYLALGTLLSFFAHQPIKVIFGQQKSLRLKALLFLIAYISPALVMFVLFLNQVSANSALPFYTAIVMMATYLVLDLLKYSRQLFVEIMAPSAIGLIAVSIVLASGGSETKAFGLGLLLSARFIPTPFYIRARLQLEKGQPADKAAAIFSAGFAFLLIGFLTILGHTPILGWVAVLVLTVRAFLGVSHWRKKSTVKAIGMREFFYGQVLVVFSTLGYWFSF